MANGEKGRKDASLNLTAGSVDNIFETHPTKIIALQIERRHNSAVLALIRTHTARRYRVTSLLFQSLGLGIWLSLLSTIVAAEEPTTKPKNILPRQTPRNVAILVFQGMELLDFAGPGEVFQAAGPKFNVYSVAESTEPIVSQKFVKIVPQYSIEDCPKPDLLVIPGGDTSAALKNPGVIAWVKRVSGETEVTMSVCTGAFILAKAGLLDGQDVTTHWFHLTRLEKAAPNVHVRSNVRFVDTGRIVTTAGVSAGIDGALHVIDRLLGHEAAARIAKGMEYKWEEASASEDK